MNQSTPTVQCHVKTHTSIVLLAAFLVFLSPSSHSALPGALTVDITVGKNSNSISSDSWNNEVVQTSAAQGLASAHTGQDSNGLGIGGSISYFFDQFELPFAVINTGIEAGFRTLGSSTRSVNWSGGSNETLHNNLNMAHLALSIQVPIARSPIFWLGKAGLGLTAMQTQFTTNIARVGNFSKNQDTAEPYLATGLGFGNNRVQFQILVEHLRLPALPDKVLASGQALGSQSSLNLMSFGFSFVL